MWKLVTQIQLKFKLPIISFYINYDQITTCHVTNPAFEHLLTYSFHFCHSETFIQLLCFFNVYVCFCLSNPTNQLCVYVWRSIIPVYFMFMSYVTDVYDNATQFYDYRVDLKILCTDNIINMIFINMNAGRLLTWGAATFFLLWNITSNVSALSEKS